jgi:hypothetical protein
LLYYSYALLLIPTIYRNIIKFFPCATLALQRTSLRCSTPPLARCRNHVRGSGVLCSSIAICYLEDPLHADIGRCGGCEPSVIDKLSVVGTPSFPAGRTAALQDVLWPTHPDCKHEHVFRCPSYYPTSFTNLHLLSSAFSAAGRCMKHCERIFLCTDRKAAP